jgi:GTPase SAR1 family protein
LREEAELLAKREDMLYCEVSAKTGAGIGKLFTEIVRRLTLEKKPS